MKNLFGKVFNHCGVLNTKVIIIIPYLLYVSTSTIASTKTLGYHGVVYALHITPFIVIGLAGNRRLNDLGGSV